MKVEKSNDLVFIDKIHGIVSNNENYNYKKDKSLKTMFLGYSFSIGMFVISLILTLINDYEISRRSYILSIIIIIIYSFMIMYTIKMSKTNLFNYSQELSKVFKIVDECIDYSKHNAEEKLILVRELDKLEMRLRVKYNIIKLENNIIYYMKDKDNFTDNIDEAKEFTHDEMLRITRLSDNYLVKTIQ
ncbi:hypothetical protein U729_3175 (plasmid) [Clostridium baratii str. Sullivan]|uniref:Uncharacterized protein n=1 Tax=Clostridium baratii str. Sullivan TaxID=1415775 RepID=A0A0A7G0L8_9CLOT|nr:hypothetical protein [Clostridium baratii]AIY85378.1 hypothetical protein U729_3175 [Clostridium baratii str. Sullivan]